MSSFSGEEPSSAELPPAEAAPAQGEGQQPAEGKAPDAGARQRDGEKGVCRAGKGRDANGFLPAGGPPGGLEVRGEELTRGFHRRS